MDDEHRVQHRMTDLFGDTEGGRRASDKKPAVEINVGDVSASDGSVVVIAGDYVAPDKTDGGSEKDNTEDSQPAVDPEPTKRLEHVSPDLREGVSALHRFFTKLATME